MLNIPFKHQNPYVTLFGWTYCFRKKNKFGLRKREVSPIIRQYIRQSKVSKTKAEESSSEPVPKKQRFYLISNNRITFPSLVLLQHNFIFLFIFQTFFPADNTLSYNQHNAIYTLQQRNTVDFGHRSWFSSFVRKGSRWKPYNQFLQIPLAAWSLLLSQRPDFLDNHLPRVPITHNQQGTNEKKEEVLSSVGAQDTDTRRYELSDLENKNIEFSWEDPAVDMDSVYRPGIGTPFSLSMFDEFQMGSTATNPIIVNDEEDSRIQNQQQQQHQSLSVQPNPPDYWEVVHSGLD